MNPRPTAFRKTAETYTPGATTLPQPYFTSPEIFAQEQQQIFSQQWLCAGHQSQLLEPGHYFLQELQG